MVINWTGLPGVKCHLLYTFIKTGSSSNINTHLYFTFMYIVFMVNGDRLVTSISVDAFLYNIHSNIERLRDLVKQVNHILQSKVEGTIEKISDMAFFDFQLAFSRSWVSGQCHVYGICCTSYRHWFYVKWTCTNV